MESESRSSERRFEPSFSRSTASAQPALSQRFLGRLLDGLAAGLAYIVLALILPGFAGELVGSLAAAAYILSCDGLDVRFMRRRSLGKYLMGTRPERLDGGAMTPEHSARRNWPFAVGYFSVLPALGWLISLVSLGLVFYEVYRLVTDSERRRWGDELARTRVTRTSTPFGSPT